METQRVIGQALLLVRASLRYNIKYTSIHFDKYRGFKGVLRDKKIAVEMGFQNFESKLDRLVQILNKLKTDPGKTIDIDLDYDSKAFIQKS